MSTGNNPSQSDDTRRIWQPRARRELTDEDCREIKRNVFGFLGVLREWAEADRKGSASAEPTTGDLAAEDHIQS